MDIAEATDADIEELARVEVESKLKSFANNEPYAIDYAGRVYRWQTYFNKQSPVSAKPERLVLKAVDDGHVIGLIAVHLTNRHKESEIETFYVLKARQREGIGTRLLQQALEWIISHKAKSLCVGIFPENLYKAFYLKYGGQYLNPHWIYWDDLELLQKVINRTG
jgi:GNAT superfamily N-acetyltransferase